MTTLPFLTLSIRRKRDAIRVRQRARQVAALLRFSPSEQACIAAASFVIACQGLNQLGCCVMCFQIESRQLHVFIQDTCGTKSASRSVSVGTDTERGMVRLVKPVPPECPAAEADLAWIVRTIATVPVNLFEEIVKQNQEVLSLLHELYTCRQQRNTGQPAQTQVA